MRFLRQVEVVSQNATLPVSFSTNYRASLEGETVQRRDVLDLSALCPSQFPTLFSRVAERNARNVDQGVIGVRRAVVGNERL